MSQKISILVPDNLHINRKNFSSFFGFVEKIGATVHFEKVRKDWVDLYGNYESKGGVLEERVRALASLSLDDLFAYTVKGVSLFKAARAEILACVSPEPTWHDQVYPSSCRAIFDKLHTENRRVLLQNLAAAWDWIEYWLKRLADLPFLTHACIFSGSLIYQKVLIELLRYTPTRVFLMESFFTGNDYYCEEKYSHTSNNSDIRHVAVRKSLLPEDENLTLRDRERIKAINKIILAKNKNVTQPEYGDELEFERDAALTVCLVGQVVNDFSVLEYRGIGLATVAFYKAVIRTLVENSFNVIFKAHPWEVKKTGVRFPLTKFAIEEFVDDLPVELRGRIHVVDHYPLSMAFEVSDFVMGLNSQALLEAAFMGFKPIQFGDAFFGRSGFTSDYELDEIEQCVSEMRTAKIRGTLNLKEFRAFEDFSLALLQRQLVSANPSGVSILQKRFSSPAPLSVIVKRPDERNEKATALSIVKDGAQVVPSGASGDGKKATNVPPTESPQSNPAAPTGVPSRQRSRLRRKWEKFWNHPRVFCADSRNVYVRSFRVFFPHRV